MELMTIKVLSLSDKQIESIYSPVVKDRFPDIDLILGCGDLTYSYLEFVVSIRRIPQRHAMFHRPIHEVYDLRFRMIVCDRIA